MALRIFKNLKQLVDGLTGRVVNEEIESNAIWQTASVTAAGTAITIAVQPGTEVLITGIHAYSQTGNNYIELAYSYTAPNGSTVADSTVFGVSTTPLTILSGVRTPVFSMLNASTSVQNLTVSYEGTITSGDLYIVSVRYVIKNLEVPQVTG